MKILATLIVTSALSVGGYLSWQKGQLPTPPAANPAPVNEPAKLAGQAQELLAEVRIAPEAAKDATKGVEAAAKAIASGKATTKIMTGQGEPVVAQFEDSELITAVEQGYVQAQLSGNGRERVVAQLRNNSPTPLRVKVPAGQVLENGRNRLVNLRAQHVELMPAQTADVKLTTAALMSTNKVGESNYRLSYQHISRLTPFIEWLAEHPEVNAAAAQTAILALLENVPAAAVAKYAPANGINGAWDTEAFRVDTNDLALALSALRDCGARVESMAISHDPQLKLELMIEPLSRNSAKRFFGISEETEWDFWKKELLSGDPSTRHYALFGIARFYPEIALEMLPKWAREHKTHPVYRMSAIQALADTQRPEALPVLKQLSMELGPQTELGKAASQAAAFLDQRLTEAAKMPVVAFRASAKPMEL